ncbi:nitronate monooxygenase family protein [Burkholderia humptydooensis]|nr:MULTISPECIES: nitronate monooxygenase [Burkholderia]AJY42374.1 nitronate monooxygenase family protein [Burkholderia sp. 2002721687]EIP84721.1 Enoyl-[acyl-carrier-protein] reductase [Burkholderia humptydooensis MSMB43]
MMRTAVTEALGIDLPIFAFSHCRDVVVEASRAGGMGILGAAWMTPEELEVSLKWIDEHVEGKPYGVDVVFPGTFAALEDERDPDQILPAEHRKFVKNLLDEAGIAPLPEDDAKEFMREHAGKMKMTPRDSERSLEIALKHPGVKFVVGAMGVPPKHVVDRIHSHGIKVGALVGSVDHARKQQEAGVDILVGQGSEAGGHVGKVSSMVLWPQLVDAVAPMPVLAAGGIGRGRQMLAAMALGAAGIWCGSIWLGSRESELSDIMKDRLFASKSEDAIVSKALTGKSCRILKSAYTEAWDKGVHPDPLTFPLQSILAGEPMRRAERSRNLDYWTYAVGQIVGDMKSETSVRQIFAEILGEYVDSMEHLQNLLDD